MPIAGFGRVDAQSLQCLCVEYTPSGSLVADNKAI
jgi:hypothetical protein